MCEYCTEVAANHKYLVGLPERRLSVDVFGKNLCLLDHSGKRPEAIGFKMISFCPMCGRKLSE